MKGSIFRLFEEFVDNTHGVGTFDLLLRDSELPPGSCYVGPGTYPAGDLLQLVAAAADRFEAEPDDLVESFARYSFGSLVGMVESLLADVDGVIGLLNSLESVIHTEVRKLDPTANPARFTVSDATATELTLHYDSDLGLFPLVIGFVKGAGDYYGESVDIEMTEARGTSATFRVSTAPVATAVGGRP